MTDDVVLWQGGLRAAGQAVASTKAHSIRFGAVLTYSVRSLVLARSPFPHEARIEIPARQVEAAAIPPALRSWPGSGTLCPSGTGSSSRSVPWASAPVRSGVCRSGI